MPDPDPARPNADRNPPQPRLVLVRQNARNGGSILDSFNTGKWVEKVAGLFEDGPVGDHKKQRGWHSNPFRLRYKQILHFVVQHTNPETEGLFKSTFRRSACKWLLTITHYDIDKLSVKYKASKHHSTTTQAQIKGQNDRLLTNWLVPQVAAQYRSACDKLWLVTPEERQPSPQEFTLRAREVSRALSAQHLGVLGWETGETKEDSCTPWAFNEIPTVITGQHAGGI